MVDFITDRFWSSLFVIREWTPYSETWRNSLKLFLMHRDYSFCFCFFSLRCFLLSSFSSSFCSSEMTGPSSFSGEISSFWSVEEAASSEDRFWMNYWSSNSRRTSSSLLSTNLSLFFCRRFFFFFSCFLSFFCNFLSRIFFIFLDLTPILWILTDGFTAGYELDFAGSMTALALFSSSSEDSLNCRPSSLETTDGWDWELFEAEDERESVVSESEDESQSASPSSIVSTRSSAFIFFLFSDLDFCFSFLFFLAAFLMSSSWSPS